MMLAAIGISEAVAGPAHAHLHRHAHEKKDAKPDVDWNSLNWDNMGINWSSAYEAGQATKTTVTSTSTAVPATAAAVVAETTEASTVATTATSSAAATTASSSSILDDIAELFDGLVGASNSRTSFGTIVKGDGTTGDSSYGNYGGPYGSNIIKVDSTASYDYTVEFVNTQSSSITVNIWNKVGPDLQPLSGSALAPKNTSLTFVLKAGASQIVAFDEDSQVAWAQACSATTASGSYSQTWGEANFVSTGSGYDMSAIENSEGNVYNMTLTSVEAPACTSDPTQNYWLTATDPVGDSDGSCYIAQSTAHLTALMAGAI
jgi:hypothetical protein